MAKEVVTRGFGSFVTIARTVLAGFFSSTVPDPSVHESTGTLDRVQATTGTLDKVRSSTGELDKLQNTTGVY